MRRTLSCVPRSAPPPKGLRRHQLRHVAPCSLHRVSTASESGVAFLHRTCHSWHGLGASCTAWRDGASSRDPKAPQPTSGQIWVQRSKRDGRGSPGGGSEEAVALWRPPAFQGRTAQACRLSRRPSLEHSGRSRAAPRGVVPRTASKLGRTQRKLGPSPIGGAAACLCGARQAPRPTHGRPSLPSGMRPSGARQALSNQRQRGVWSRTRRCPGSHRTRLGGEQQRPEPSSNSVECSAKFVESSPAFAEPRNPSKSSPHMGECSPDLVELRWLVNYSPIVGKCGPKLAEPF